MILGDQNQGIQEYLEGITPPEAMEYSREERQREKWGIFQHLRNAFKPLPSKSFTEEENEITEFLDAPFQMDFPHKQIYS